MKKRPIFGFRLTSGLYVALVAAVGCGGNTATVSGKVSYGGKPVTSGVVLFVSQDDKVSATAPIHADGTYSIAKAPVGKVKAGIDNRPPPGAPGGEVLSGAPNDETKAALAEAARYTPTPDSYRDPKQSGLSYEVKPGRNIINIDLK